MKTNKPCDRDFMLVASKPRSYGFKDLTGRRFTRLLVMGFLPKHGASQHHYWLCVCDCGAIRTPSSNKLLTRGTKSCGCWRGDHIHKPIGDVRQKDMPENRSYWHMRYRCTSPKNRAYPEYGGRGITVCDRWLKGEGGLSGFRCFLADMGPKPSSRHSIDRKNNDGNYEPENCRWATDKQQARNRRSNRYITIDGQRMSVPDACEMLGLNYGVVNNRLKRGWSLPDALTPLQGVSP